MSIIRKFFVLPTYLSKTRPWSARSIKRRNGDFASIFRTRKVFYSKKSDKTNKHNSDNSETTNCDGQKKFDTKPNCPKKLGGTSDSSLSKKSCASNISVNIEQKLCGKNPDRIIFTVKCIQKKEQPNIANQEIKTIDAAKSTSSCKKSTVTTMPSDKPALKAVTSKQESSALCVSKPAKKDLICTKKEKSLEEMPCQSKAQTRPNCLKPKKAAQTQTVELTKSKQSKTAEAAKCKTSLNVKAVKAVECKKSKQTVKNTNAKKSKSATNFKEPKIVKKCESTQSLPASRSTSKAVTVSNAEKVACTQKGEKLKTNKTADKPEKLPCELEANTAPNCLKTTTAPQPKADVASSKSVAKKAACTQKGEKLKTNKTADKPEKLPCELEAKTESKSIKPTKAPQSKADEVSSILKHLKPVETSRVDNALAVKASKSNKCKGHKKAAEHADVKKTQSASNYEEPKKMKKRNSTQSLKNAQSSQPKKCSEAKKCESMPEKNDNIKLKSNETAQCQKTIPEDVSKPKAADVSKTSPTTENSDKTVCKESQKAATFKTTDTVTANSTISENAKAPCKATDTVTESSTISENSKAAEPKKSKSITSLKSEKAKASHKLKKNKSASILSLKCDRYTRADQIKRIKYKKTVQPKAAAPVKSDQAESEKLDKPKIAELPKIKNKSASTSTLKCKKSNKVESKKSKKPNLIKLKNSSKVEKTKNKKSNSLFKCKQSKQVKAQKSKNSEKVPIKQAIKSVEASKIKQTVSNLTLKCNKSKDVRVEVAKKGENVQESPPAKDEKVKSAENCMKQHPIEPLVAQHKSEQKAGVASPCKKGSEVGEQIPTQAKDGRESENDISSASSGTTCQNKEKVAAAAASCGMACKKGGSKTANTGGNKPHAPKSKTYRNISLATILLVMGFCGYTFMNIEHKERPEFVPYEYLYRRNKRFPWGDGTKSYFHNAEVNALPDGYEEAENGEVD